MTTKTPRIAQHTVVLDANGLELAVTAPENLDSTQLAQDIAECICFDIKATLKALANRGYERGAIGIDDQNAWACADLSAEVTETELTDDEA